jgi:hypothetical protein
MRKFILGSFYFVIQIIFIQSCSETPTGNPNTPNNIDSTNIVRNISLVSTYADYQVLSSNNGCYIYSPLSITVWRYDSSGNLKWWKDKSYFGLSAASITFAQSISDGSIVLRVYYFGSSNLPAKLFCFDTSGTLSFSYNLPEYNGYQNQFYFVSKQNNELIVVRDSLFQGVNIMRIATSGNILSNQFVNSSDTISTDKLIEDADGYLIGSAWGSDNSIIRINKSGQILWRTTLHRQGINSDSTWINGLGFGPNNTFLVFTGYAVDGDRKTAFSITQSGNISWTKELPNGWNPLIKSNGGFYLLSYFNVRNFLSHDFDHILFSYNADGIQQWSKSQFDSTYSFSVSGLSSFYYSPFCENIDNNVLFLVYNSNKSSYGLIKMDSNGTFLWK